MTLLDRIVNGCLGIAHRRWPEELRAEQLREWSAELHALRHETGSGSLRRGLAQLRFAWSLAWSPPVGDENGVPRGWRETLPGVGRALRPILALSGATLLCVVIVSGLLTIVGALLGQFRGYASGVEPFWQADRVDWAAHGVSLAAAIAAAVLLFWIGRSLGRLAPLWWAHRGRLAVTGSALVAPMCVGLSLAAVLALFAAGRQLTNSYPALHAAIAVWAALMAVLGIRVVRQVHRGHRARAAVTAVAGGVIAVNLAGIIAGLPLAIGHDADLAMAPLWAVFSMLDPLSTMAGPGHADFELIGAYVAMPVRSLFALTALMFGYAISTSRVPVERQAHVRVAAPGRARATTVTTRTIPIWVGGAFAAVALAIWVYGLTALTGALNQVTDPTEEHHIWAQEIRQAAILAAVLGLGLVLVGRGPFLVPAILACGALIIIDSVTDSLDAVDARAGVYAGALGLIVLFGASWLSTTLRHTPPDETASRRVLAGMSILAASCAPAVIFHLPGIPTLLPAGFDVASTAAVVLLTVMGLVSALAARKHPIRIVIAIPLVLIISAGAGAASLLYVAELPIGFVIAAPLAAAAWAIACWDRPTRPVLRWTGLALGAIVAAIPLAYAQLSLAFMSGPILMLAAGYEHPADGLAFLPGAIPVGLALAVLATAKRPLLQARVSLPDQTRPSQEPA